MFRRVILEDWHSTLSVLGFLLTAGVFSYLVVRTLRLRRDREDRLARLPLESDTPPPPPRP